MDIVLTVVLAIVGIFVIAVILYVLFKLFQKSASFYKEVSNGKVTLHVKANCDVRKIRVLLKSSKNVKPFELARTKVVQGEEVTFVFKQTKIPPKLIVECHNGTFEYEVH
jgi:hypothetical protein